MGMSKHVVGVRDLDGRFAKMLAAKLACEEADVEYPNEVRNYFSCLGAEATADNLRIEMQQVDIEIAVRKWADGDCRDGFEVELALLPEGVKAIRFYTAY